MGIDKSDTGNTIRKLVLATSLNFVDTNNSDGCCSTIHDNAPCTIISGNCQSEVSASDYCKINSLALLHETANLLYRQWPRGRSADGYLHKMMSNLHGLPASYILVQYNDPSTNNSNEPKQHSIVQILGHGRLTECYESLAGNAAAATYIVIHEDYRGTGCGRQLMTLLEEQAASLGYHYMYLWTNTATEFYKKLGYQETERMSLHRACLKPLQCDEVNRLEDMLRSKVASIFANISKQTKQSLPVTRTETVLLPPPDDNSPKENDIWLRKRLVEYLDCSTLVSIEDRIEEMKEGIADYRLRLYKQGTDRRHCTYHWTYYLVQVPWQQQVGPSCGLAALRMVRDYYCTKHCENSNIKANTARDRNDNHEEENLQITTMMPSLLNEAKILGYTDDGEVFDSANLIKLATNVCGLKCTMRSFRRTTPTDMLRIIQTIENVKIDDNMNDTLGGRCCDKQENRYSHGILIVPYDTNKRTKLPCNLSGMMAHYGIIVGIVFGKMIEHNPSCSNTQITSNNINTGIDNNNNTSTNGIDVLVDGWVEMNSNNPDTLNAIGMDDILLLVQHGLSSKLSIASWDEFFISNQQLTTYDNVKYKHVTKLNLQDCLIEFQGFAE